jgi:hypothetical protein
MGSSGRSLYRRNRVLLLLGRGVEIMWLRSMRGRSLNSRRRLKVLVRGNSLILVRKKKCIRSS